MKKIIVGVLLLLFITVIVICYLNNSKKNEAITNLKPVSIIELGVPEPSGLCFDKSNNSLWTVSDENSTIYNIDLAGNILSTIVVNGFDLEGITIIDDSTLAAIFERDRTIVLLNKSGRELKRIKLSLTGEPNKGLEGITFNKSNNHLYVLNEKDPGVLIEVDTTGRLIKKKELKFTTDYSGLSYIDVSKQIWIISDEGEAIFKCTKNAEVINKYKVNIEQIEGIAIDPDNSILYIVSDPLEKLYIYQLP